MALVPMKQKATRIRPGQKDDWGNVISDPSTLVMKCRVTEVTTVVNNIVGEEVVSSATILFDKLPDIQYDDVISYTNELGVTVEGTPIKIEPVRMINGKVTMTGVYVGWRKLLK